jgi:serine/threonine protein kinase
MHLPTSYPQDFHEQYQTWASLGHPNLAAIHFVDSEEFTLFQEYCENGDLREVLHSKTLYAFQDLTCHHLYSASNKFRRKLSTSGL